MMDDVFLYHAHTFFLWCMMCVGTRTRMSTSVEHELTKRALESIPQVSSRSNPALIPFACFASFMLANCSFLWFDCKHVDGIIAPCDIHVSLLLDIDALCVATKMLNNFSFRCFVCNHNAIKSMYCHESIQVSRRVVATNIRTTCPFIWFFCKHVVFSSAWDTHIPMIFAFDDLCVTSNMLNNFSFQWLVCTRIFFCFGYASSCVFAKFSYYCIKDVDLFSQLICVPPYYVIWSF